MRKSDCSKYVIFGGLNLFIRNVTTLYNQAEAKFNASNRRDKKMFNNKTETKFSFTTSLNFYKT